MPGSGQTLAQLAEGIDIKTIQGEAGTVVTGIAMDSRQIRPGDLFACVPGFNADGHDFAGTAQKAGAAALLVERLLPVDLPQIQVDSVREHMGIMAARIFGYPVRDLEIVGVTGTNGKTTITHLIEKMGAKAGRKVGLIGTLGARIDGRDIPGSRTTPEAIDLQRLFRQMVDEGVRLVVMEVSSHALVLGRVNGCEFDAGIFTNLTQDHLDYHKTMEEYLAAKSKLFSGLKGEKQPKIAVLNGDDPACSFLQKVSAAPVVTYGLGEGMDYQARDILITPEGVSFDVHFKGQSIPVRYATPGLFSVYNSLAAFTWGVERGMEPAMLTGALGEITGVPGRFESVKMGQPFHVIVDYAHTPDGLENVLRTARDFTKGRLITVFGCGGDRDRTKRPLMGAVAGQWSDDVIVTSDNPRTEDPEAIIRDIVPGLPPEGDHVLMPDRRAAIAKAIGKAKAGDTVLIAGKGHEDYQIIGKEVHPFDDRLVAGDALRGLGYGVVG